MSEKKTEGFKKISPFGKIPVITDHENGQSLFESGAILIYLAEKYNKFYEAKDRNVINQWLMAQMGIIGPMIGQHHQFHHYNPRKSEFGEERYFKITKRIYQELDSRLKKSKPNSRSEVTMDMLSMDSIETGRVEKGGSSDQSFKTVNKTFNHHTCASSVWKILPVSQKVYEKQDLKVYCSNCGKKRKKDSDKFCSSCGNKF